MNLKFKDEPYGCTVSVGLNIYNLKEPFLDLHNKEENTSLFDNFDKPLAVSTHLVWVNDLLESNVWLKQYQLYLYKNLFADMTESTKLSQISTRLNQNLERLSQQLLLEDLPVNFDRNLDINLELLKYLKLKLDPVQDINSLFDQLLRIHLFVCPNKLLLINHALEYDLDLANFKDKVADMQLTVVLLHY